MCQEGCFGPKITSKMAYFWCFLRRARKTTKMGLICACFCLFLGAFLGYFDDMPHFGAFWVQNRCILGVFGGCKLEKCILHAFLGEK